MVRYGLVILLFSQLTCLLVFDFLVLTEETYYDSLSQSMESNQIDTFLRYKNRYKWVGYLVSTVFPVLRLFVVSFVLYAAGILNDTKVRFKESSVVAFFGECVLFIPIIIKTIHFITTKTNYNIEDIHYFYPLSILSLFDPKALDPVWIYPFQTANLFEITYWFVLAYGIYRFTKMNFEDSFSLVARSYLPTLILWVVFVMFLTVTFSPA